MTTVGPLDLTPMVQANLNAVLNASGMAVVQTPTQGYAVEYLPRYAQIQAHEASSARSGTATTSTSTAATNPSSLSALESNLTIEGIPAKEIANWVKTGSNGVAQWTSTELADLEKALKISPKPTATKPGLNVQAQVLAPPLANGSAPAADSSPRAQHLAGLRPDPRRRRVAAMGRQKAAFLRQAPSRQRAGQRQRGDSPAGGCRRDELVRPVRESALEVGLERVAPRLDEPGAVRRAGS